MERVFRAPGRVNLIGEHTDYNGGWVMPAAIPLAVTAAISPRPGRQLRLYSDRFAEPASFDLDAAAANLPPWARSLRGVAVLLDRRKPLGGADLRLRSEIPMGAGLSSSAAVEVAVGLALATAVGLDISRTALAFLCQQASHEFAGSRCGLMDQFIACHGRAGQILRLDTRSLEQFWQPWPAALRCVVCDTGVRHDNAAGGYNRRRSECEAAAAFFGCSLGDVSARQLEAAHPALDSILYRRARHVISENARVGAAATALAAGGFAALGQILNASHASLRDDFEVSCPELDTLAAWLQRQPGFWGARMMGAGFGGCVLALARPGAVDAIRGSAPARAIWEFEPAAGATEVVHA
ncbi:MAG: galactokinase [Terriglobales bacterium]